MRKVIFSVVIVLASIAIVQAQGAKVQSAFNYMKSLEFEDARAAIDEAIQDSKTGAQAKTWYYRGAIYQQLYVDTALRKKYPQAITEAIRSFQKAMELDPKNQWKPEIQQGLNDVALYAFNEGVAPYNRKEYQAAYDRFIQAATTYEYLNAEFQQGLIDTFATLYAANAASKMKKYDEAMPLYQKLQAKNISLPQLYSNMGDVYLVRGDTAKAIEIFSEGAKMFPDDKGLMVQELNLYLFSGKYEDAINKLKAGIEKDPNFTALYVQLGSMYEQVNDTGNARKTYEQAIQKDASSFDAYYRLGALYYNKAVEIHNQMNKLDVNQQKQYDVLEVQRNSEFRKALPHLERALQLDGKDMDTLIALKELYARLGQIDKSNEMKNRIEALKG